MQQKTTTVVDIKESDCDHEITLYFQYILTFLGWSFSSHAQENEELVECTLCVDPTHQPQDPMARFVTGDGNTITCQSAYDLGNISLSNNDCEFWQWRGQGICQCSNETLPVNNCTLCQDGTLPEALREAIPGETCAQVQVDAKRDDPDLCPVYQQTIGVYCNCTNEPVEYLCRLCVTTPLPKPLTFVEPIQKSCVELEFQANLQDADCAAFQALYQDICCAEDSATEDGDGGEDSSRAERLSSWGYNLGLLLLSGLFHITLQS